MHYRRWTKYGDPLFERYGQPARLLKEIVDQNPSECVFWPFGLSHGYGRVWLDGKQVSAHRAVCSMVHGDPPTLKHEAAHTCGNGSKGCVSPRHLRWATRQENEADKLIHGTSNRGARHGMAKITDEIARQIKASAEPRREIAKRFGVKKDTVHKIKQGKLWRHV
jgi:hypothetical protein